MAVHNVHKHIKNIASGSSKNAAGSASGVVGDLRKTFPNSTGKGAANDKLFDPIDKIEEVAIDDANKAVQAVDGTLNGMGTTIGIQLAPAAAAATAGAVGWLGEKTGLSTIGNAGRGAQGKIKGFMDSSMQEAFGGNRAGKVIAKTTGKITSFSGNILSKVGLNSASAVVKDIPANLGKAKVGEGLFNSTWLASSAIGVAGGALSFSKSLMELKRLSTELSGQHCSTLDVITGNVPEILKQERLQLLKGFAVSEGGSTLSLGVAVRSVARGFSMPLMLATTAIGMGAGMLVGEGFLPTYSAMREAYDAGQPIPAEAYANLIGVASKDLAEHGGPGGAFTQKIAEQFAEKNASPVDVMKEIQNGGIMKRVQALIAAAEAEKAAKAATTEPEKPAHSHVAALSAPKPKFDVNKKREVIGDKTRQIVDSAIAAKGIEAAQPAI